VSTNVLRIQSVVTIDPSCRGRSHPTIWAVLKPAEVKDMCDDRKTAASGKGTPDIGHIDAVKTNVIHNKCAVSKVGGPCIHECAKGCPRVTLSVIVERIVPILPLSTSCIRHGRGSILVDQAQPSLHYELPKLL